MTSHGPERSRSPHQYAKVQYLEKSWRCCSATIANRHNYRQSAVRQYGRLSYLVFTVFKRSQSVYDASQKQEILISSSFIRCVHSSSRCQKFKHTYIHMHTYMKFITRCIVEYSSNQISGILNVKCSAMFDLTLTQAYILHFFATCLIYVLEQAVNTNFGCGMPGCTVS